MLTTAITIIDSSIKNHRTRNQVFGTVFDDLEVCDPPELEPLADPLLPSAMIKTPISWVVDAPSYLLFGRVVVHSCTLNLANES